MSRPHARDPSRPVRTRATRWCAPLVSQRPVVPMSVRLSAQIGRGLTGESAGLAAFRRPQADPGWTRRSSAGRHPIRSEKVNTERTRTAMQAGQRSAFTRPRSRGWLRQIGRGTASKRDTRARVALVQRRAFSHPRAGHHEMGRPSRGCLCSVGRLGRKASPMTVSASKSLVRPAARAALIGASQELRHSASGCVSPLSSASRADDQVSCPLGGWLGRGLAR